MRKKLSTHFYLDEFERSKTALHLGIKNLAPAKAVENLAQLCEAVLEPLRKHCKTPLYISSGYRCVELNRIVGGNPSSKHLAGQAADIYTPELKPEQLFQLLQRMSKAKLAHFDQLILYPTFIHIAYCEGKNRNQSFLGR